MPLKNILYQYWGYSSFRPLQEEIITSVLENRDTLALLPTGGGKSVCFQVPALYREGVCLVITPLIALMKDQVANLRKKGIKAAAIYSGMSRFEIDVVLGNCKYGGTKFLYLSPERLESELIRHNLQRIRFNLVAVDEAHCISQWGYDFRPPYLKIAEIRALLPGVPVLALTATATEPVIRDIQSKLQFSAENVFRKSFERQNLVYYVANEEDKLGRLVRITEGVKGCGIVYVRNRRRTREIADFLSRREISAEAYHAGMEPRERDIRQASWMNGEKRVMVATNAFGMGIDKPNVRFVVHLDLPDSLEAYFQEAGRAGRDEKRAWAVLLYDQADILDARKNLSVSFPGLQAIRDVYQALGNFYQLPAGSGKDLSFDFHLADFSAQYNFQPLVVFNSIRFLEKEGYLCLNERPDDFSKLMVRQNKEELYKFQLDNPYYDGFIKVLLRSYSGLFADYVKISESEIAKRAGIPKETALKNLEYLDRREIISFIPMKTLPQLVFTTERMDAKDLYLSKETYRERRLAAEQRLESMIGYALSELKCRSQYLLEYFGDEGAKRCGMCDICIERNKIDLNELEFDRIIGKIKPLLKRGPMSLETLIRSVAGEKEDRVIRVIQWLSENNKILRDEDGQFRWN